MGNFRAQLRRRCVWPTVQDCITAVYQQSANNMQNCQSLCVGTSKGEFELEGMVPSSSNKSRREEFCRKERVGKANMPSCCRREFDPLLNLVLNNSEELLRDPFTALFLHSAPSFSRVYARTPSMCRCIAVLASSPFPAIKASMMARCSSQTLMRRSGTRLIMSN